MKSYEAHPDSSNIHRISWTDKEDGSEPVLTIEFVSGQTWQYLGVSEEAWNDFTSAPSAGKYFHGFIKGQYEAKRL